MMATEQQTILSQLIAERGTHLTYFPDTEAVKKFPLDDSDLVLAGYMKSGTNWMQVVLANLWDDWGTCAITDRRQVPNLSGANDVPHYAGYDYCLRAKPPRLMKAHFSRHCMPERWPGHGKVIHIMRNPKDVCVSLYSELRDSIGLKDTFEEYFEKFMAGSIGPYGSYLDNISSWRRFDHRNLLKITYEELRADVRSVLERIIAFVGRPVSEARLDAVIAKTEFTAMRSNELRFQINHFRYADDNKPFLRKGEVGGWKAGLSAAQSARIEKEIIEPLGFYGSSN